MPSPVVASWRKTMWPDCSPPRSRAPRLERLEHVTVPDRGLERPTIPRSAMARRKPEVGHHRDHHRVGRRAARGRPGRGRRGRAACRRRPPPRCGPPPPAGRRRRRRPAPGRAPSASTVVGQRGRGWVEPQPSLMLAPSGAQATQVDLRPERGEDRRGDGAWPPRWRSRARRAGPSSRRPRARRPGGAGRRRRRPASVTMVADAVAGAAGRAGGSGRPAARPARPRWPASIVGGQLGAPGAEQLDAVVGEGVVGGRDHGGRQTRARPRGRPPPAWAARPRSTTSAPSAASPAERAAWRRGPERRVSRPTRKAGAPSTRAAARPRASASSAVSSRWPHPGPRRCRSAAAAATADLPLGVLRRLAGLLQAVLLALLLAGVAGEEAGPLEGGPQLGVERRSGPGRCRGAAHRPGRTPRRRRWWRRCRRPRWCWSAAAGSVTTMRWVAEVK